MKAVRFHQQGDPSVLVLDDIEVPAPASGQVRLRVTAAGFNQADTGMRAGTLPIPVSLPHIPGYDVAGVVDALGDGVEGLAIGDTVIGFLPMDTDGAAAEYAVAPADVLVPAPTSVSLVEAAAIPSVGLTAWQALFEQAHLEEGQRILIVGAGGTVGGYAVGLAADAGATVLATASPRSAAAVEAAGAAQVIDHTSGSVQEAVGEEVDVLLNLAPIDPAEFVSLVSLVRDGGVVVSTTAWMPAPADEERGVTSSVVFVRSDREQLTHLVELVDAGGLAVPEVRTVSLSGVRAVHEESGAGTLRGKVVVVPTEA
ncbi:NADP-dependent oxidoreductase [Frondihabitans peucedani]|uniref:NADP-dependent oxidoreductase n=1 Tax=Frondihabitans peucedani TaxID=598626 RepID=A0ABP8E1V3_9MICO